jgi:hypothetical protein
MDDGSVQTAILYNAVHINLTILKKEFCNEYEFDKTCKETVTLQISADEFKPIFNMWRKKGVASYIRFRIWRVCG